MAKRSRVGRMPDTAALGRAVAFPGIDPRTWVSYGIVTGYAIDPQEGIFVNVTLMPSRIQETARVGDSWASGDGVSIPFDDGDEVVVGYPDGDPSYGLAVLRRMYSPSDLPAKLAVDNPDAITVVSKRKVFVQLHNGAELVVQSVKDTSETSDPGKITVIGKDILVTADNIKLGGETSLHKVARKDDPITTQMPLDWVTWFIAVGTALGLPSPITIPPITIPPTEPAVSWNGTIADGSSVVYAK